MGAADALFMQSFGLLNPIDLGLILTRYISIVVENGFFSTKGENQSLE